MKVKVNWEGKMRFEAVGDSGHTVVMDTAPSMGGEDQGPRPMEMVLMALGGCTGIDVVAIMNKQRAPIDRLEIEIDAERAAEEPRVFTSAVIKYHIWGSDVAEDKVRRAIELTQEKYCSVLHMVNKTAKIDYSYEIHR